MKSLYDSGFHHPLAAYLGSLVLLGLLARRVPFLVGYLAFFVVEILADANVTGAWSPVASSSWLFEPLSIAFVILGDLRYFLLVERYVDRERSTGGALARALPISLIVPIVTGVGTRLVPALHDPRVLFLVYELMLFVVVLVHARVVLGPRDAEGPLRAFLRATSAFVLVQYAGWALADVLILSGVEAGYLLRIVPNVLYYAGFLIFVAARAPREAYAA